VPTVQRNNRPTVQWPGYKRDNRTRDDAFFYVRIYYLFRFQKCVALHSMGVKLHFYLQLCEALSLNYANQSLVCIFIIIKIPIVLRHYNFYLLKTVNYE